MSPCIQLHKATHSNFCAYAIANPSGRLNLQDQLTVSRLVGSEKTMVDVLVRLVNGYVLLSSRSIRPSYTATLSERYGMLSQFTSRAKAGAAQLCRGHSVV